jgi:hypothetical protein
VTASRSAFGSSSTRVVDISGDKAITSRVAHSASKDELFTDALDCIVNLGSNGDATEIGSQNIFSGWEVIASNNCRNFTCQ